MHRAPLRLGRRAFLGTGLTAAAGLVVPRAARARVGDDHRVAQVLAHHARSSHTLERSAPAPRQVAWDDQPDPFRRYRGAPLLALDEVPPTARPGIGEALAGEAPPRPLDRAGLSQLLYDALALSAWKTSGAARWPLRVNPSSGNLHPLEAYLVGGPFAGVTAAPALLHYAPHEHALEERAVLPPALWGELAGALPPGAVLAGLTRLTWREAWKYGERGWRYTLLDTGHAVAALAVAAAALGHDARLLAWPDRDVARLLGLDGPPGRDAERPEALLALWPSGARWPAVVAPGLPPGTRRVLATLPHRGTPTPVGGSGPEWPAAEAAARAAERDVPGPPAAAEPAGSDDVGPSRDDPGLRAVVRARRTAPGFTGDKITREALARVLARALPAVSPALFRALRGAPRVHLALWVHRVEGLAPGVYVLPRDAAALPGLRGAFPDGAAPALPVHGELALWRLAAGDLRARARRICCDQASAADGAFTAALLAPLEATLGAAGAPAYRELHWEAGAVGHALYLGAGAAGLGATAMGCYADAEARQLVGLRDGDAHAVLYTVAVGPPRADPRLDASAPYRHRAR